MSSNRSHNFIVFLFVIFAIVGTLLGSSGGLVVCVSGFGDQAIEFIHVSHEVNHTEIACDQTNRDQHDCLAHQKPECEDVVLEWDFILRSSPNASLPPLILALLGLEKPLQVTCLPASQTIKSYWNYQLSLETFTSRKTIASTILLT